MEKTGLHCGVDLHGDNGMYGIMFEGSHVRGVTCSRGQAFNNEYAFIPTAPHDPLFTVQDPSSHGCYASASGFLESRSFLRRAISMCV